MRGMNLTVKTAKIEGTNITRPHAEVNVDTGTDTEGRQILLINDIHFGNMSPIKAEDAVLLFEERQYRMIRKDNLTKSLIFAPARAA